MQTVAVRELSGCAREWRCAADSETVGPAVWQAAGDTAAPP